MIEIIIVYIICVIVTGLFIKPILDEIRRKNGQLTRRHIVMATTMSVLWPVTLVFLIIVSWINHLLPHNF